MQRYSYRVWNPEHQKYEKWDGFNPSIPDRILDSHKNPVQQFTGKLDIEGKEIWEGDLVELRYAVQLNSTLKESFGVYEVFYDDYYACFSLKVYKRNWYDNGFGDTHQIAEYSGVCRVIGNLYENADLLKKD